MCPSKRSSASNIVSHIALTDLETVCNVVGVGAVFSSGVAVGSERLSAVCAGEAVDCSAVDLFRVGVPPEDTAAVRAESDTLSAWCLFERHTALRAEIRIQTDTAVI